jgi:Contractile injection system tape measure protein
MTEQGEVTRMHLRCAAPRRREGEALALRARLERTARVHLPAALDPTLSRRGERVFADRVAVRLDFDPSAYDDVTIAVLWGKLVGDALEAPRPGARADGVVRFSSDRDFDAAALAEVAATGRLSWIFAELRCGTGVVAAETVLAALARLGRARAAGAVETLVEDEELARRLFDRLAQAERDASLVRLAQALGTAPPKEAPRRASAGGGGSDAAVAPLAGRTTPRGAGGAEGDPAGRGRSAAAPSGNAFAAWHRDLVALVDGSAQSPWPAADAADETCARPRVHARAAEIESKTGAPATPDRSRRRDPFRPRTRRAEAPGADERGEPDEPETARWTRVGGLVFLYPWLADYLEPRPFPNLPRLEARRWALAALADPEDERLPLDPLVRLLAGDEPLTEREPTARPDLPDGLVEAAEGVLSAFAASVPGFAESTAGFVRAHFLARGGLLEPLPEAGWRAVLEPAPLDPILDLLPYPVEAFRLPWTPTVFVRRRSRDARP